MKKAGQSLEHGVGRAAETRQSVQGCLVTQALGRPGCHGLGKMGSGSCIPEQEVDHVGRAHPLILLRPTCPAAKHEALENAAPMLGC